MILAGGRSARMGHDKARLPFAGHTLLDRTVRTLLPVASPLVVVAGADQALPPLDARVVMARDETPHPGPLAAIAAALGVLDAPEGAVFVCGTDHPLLKASVVLRLAALLEAPTSAVVATIGGEPQPLCAVYRARSLSSASDLVARGERSMKALLAALDVRLVERQELLADPAVLAEDPGLFSFLDVDTRADLEELEQLLLDEPEPTA